MYDVVLLEGELVTAVALVVVQRLAVLGVHGGPKLDRDRAGRLLPGQWLRLQDADLRGRTGGRSQTCNTSRVSRGRGGDQVSDQGFDLE